MNAFESELIKTFANETAEILDLIGREITQLKGKNESDKKAIQEIISKIRVIKGNATTFKITSIEKLCGALEDIFNGVLDGRLKITSRLQKLLELVSQKINSILENLSNGADNDDTQSIVIYLAYCDRISSGELIDIRKMEREILGEVAVSNPEDEEGFISTDGTISNIHTIRVKTERINEIIASCDSLITKEFRLKHQLEELRKLEEETGLTAISKIRKQLSFDIETLESQIFDMQQQIFDLRVMPIAIALDPLEKEILEIAKEFGKEVEAEIPESKIMLDKEILEQLGGILSLLIRNTISGAIEKTEKRIAAGKNPKSKITVLCTSDMNSVRLVIKNDGQALEYEKLRKHLRRIFPEREDELLRLNDREIAAYLFRPNFLSNDNTLVEAHERIEKIKGRISIENNRSGVGTKFVLRFPLSLATQQGLFVKSRGQKLLLPAQHILDVIHRKQSDFITLQNQTCLNHEGELVPLYSLNSLLEGTDEQDKNTDTFNIVIAEYMEQKAGIIVDNVLGYVSLAVKPLPNGFSKFPSLQGIVFDEYYAIVPILNLQDIITRFKAMRSYDIQKYEAKSRKIIRKILAVDNSKMTRQIELSTLENAGFSVDTASDGIEATDLMKEKQYDLIVSGTEMPRMDGITLLENMRRDKNYEDVPFIAVFPVPDDAEMKRYSASGANAFFVKSDFSRDAMISKVKELLNA